MEFEIVAVFVPKFFTQFSIFGEALPVLSQVYKALGACARAALEIESVAATTRPKQRPLRRT
jgi:hypothetical protein